MVNFAALEQLFSQKTGQNLNMAAESCFKSFLMTNTYTILKIKEVITAEFCENH